jgi:hypothetical protein
MAITELGPISWENIIAGHEAVKRRLRQSVDAMMSVNVPYAVIGGNAVAAWVRRANIGGERGTPNVDLLIHRHDLPKVAVAFKRQGFAATEDESVYLESAEDRPRDRIRLFFASERVRPTYVLTTPTLDRIVLDELGHIIDLDALIEMKLTSFRTIDRVHLRDMIDVGLIDSNWLTRFPELLRTRLQQLLDDPDG